MVAPKSCNFIMVGFSFFSSKPILKLPCLSLLFSSLKLATEPANDFALWYGSETLFECKASPRVKLLTPLMAKRETGAGEMAFVYEFSTAAPLGSARMMVEPRSLD